MADDGDIGIGGKGPCASQRKTATKLFMLVGCTSWARSPCTSACFECCQQYNSQKWSTKTLTTLFPSPLCTDTYLGGEVVSAVVILVFFLASVAHFNSSQKSRCPVPSGLLQPRHQGGTS